MLNILRTSWRTGQVTTGYPFAPEAAPPAFRGAPALDPNRCDGSAVCVEVCPSEAITFTQREDESRHWRLDLARCVFCGLCQEACPKDAIQLTQSFELAARTRAELVVDEEVRGLPPSLGETPSRRYSYDVELVREGLGEQVRRLDDRIKALLRRSLHIRHMDAGSDNSADWELNALLNPIYDIQRLGIDFVASPRHADLLLVTGSVTRNLEPALMATYTAMPEPRLVVAAGADACGGGILQHAYAAGGGVDNFLHVDVYVPGDPPRPQALIYGLMLVLDRLAT